MTSNPYKLVKLWNSNHGVRNKLVELWTPEAAVGQGRECFRHRGKGVFISKSKYLW